MTAWVRRSSLGFSLRFRSHRRLKAPPRPIRSRHTLMRNISVGRRKVRGGKSNKPRGALELEGRHTAFVLRALRTQLGWIHRLPGLLTFRDFRKTWLT